MVVEVVETCMYIEYILHFCFPSLLKLMESKVTQVILSQHRMNLPYFKMRRRRRGRGRMGLRLVSGTYLERTMVSIRYCIQAWILMVTMALRLTHHQQPSFGQELQFHNNLHHFQAFLTFILYTTTLGLQIF